MKLNNQVAIVTGGALGIGGCVARKLAREGSKVLIVDIAEEEAKKNKETIEENGGIAEYLIGDVALESVAKEMVDLSVSLFGRLDIIVQNAYGGLGAGSAVDINIKDWNKGLNLLVGALYLGAKYAVPAMEDSGVDSNFIPKQWKGFGLRQGNPPKENIGRIINISSVHGILNAPKSIVYETGKSAVIGMTRQMAVDFGPLGITVNAIAPGHIVTERGDDQWKKVGNNEGFRLFELQYPVRRTGTPQDVANMISFLCSHEASFITGQTIAVDGGLSVQLQEDLVMDLKNFISTNKNLRTHFDKEDKSRDRW